MCDHHNVCRLYIFAAYISAHDEDCRVKICALYQLYLDIYNSFRLPVHSTDYPIQF